MSASARTLGGWAMKELAEAANCEVRLFAHVQLDVFRAEVGREDGVIRAAEMQVDGDGDFLLGDDFLQLGKGRLARHAALYRDQAIVENIDRFLAQFRSAIAEGVHDAAPVGIAAEPRALGQGGIGHGFRGLASTALYERQFASDHIELQLAHVRGKVRGAYDHSRQLPQRRKMMEFWADFLDDRLRNSTR